MKISSPKMILYAAYASLVYLILYIAEFYLTVFYYIPYIAPLHVLEIVLSIVVYAGWIETGKFFKNPLLLNISIASLFLIPVAGILNIMFSVMGPFPIFYTLISSMIMGILVTIFGVALRRMKKQFGELANAAGIINIVAGICLLSYILLPVAVLLLPPSLAIEAVLLFTIYKKAKPSPLLEKLDIFNKIKKILSFG